LKDASRRCDIGDECTFGRVLAPRVFKDLDEWIRHRLRQVQLKQWKRGKTIYRELRRRGTADDIARQVAANSRRWWRNSAMLLNVALPTSYYDAMGVPRLAR
jgi:RNA-directed DNA polymerase